MLLLKKAPAPLGLRQQMPLAGPRSLVVLRYREQDRTAADTTSTTQRRWQDSPYYAGASDDPSESLRNGFNNLKAKWDDWEPEKRNQMLAWGGGGLLALYLANGLINQIDRLPLLPEFLQLVGFAFTSWFAFRYLLYAEGREDLSRISLDKLLGKAGEEATSDFARGFSEGAEGIADAGDRLRKSEAGRALKEVASDSSSSSSRLSDGNSGAYSDRELRSSIKSARRDLEDNLP